MSFTAPISDFISVDLTEKCLADVSLAASYPTRPTDAMAALFTMAVFDVNPVEKQYVIVNIQVQRRTETLDEF